jgi:hypothetical protein
LYLVVFVLEFIMHLQRHFGCNNISSLPCGIFETPFCEQLIHGGHVSLTAQNLPQRCS